MADTVVGSFFIFLLNLRCILKFQICLNNKSWIRNSKNSNLDPGSATLHFCANNTVYSKSDVLLPAYRRPC